MKNWEIQHLKQCWTWKLRRKKKWKLCRAGKKWWDEGFYDFNIFYVALFYFISIQIIKENNKFNRVSHKANIKKYLRWFSSNENVAQVSDCCEEIWTTKEHKKKSIESKFQASAMFSHHFHRQFDYIQLHKLFSLLTDSSSMLHDSKCNSENFAILDGWWVTKWRGKKSDCDCEFLVVRRETSFHCYTKAEQHTIDNSSSSESSFDIGGGLKAL